MRLNKQTLLPLLALTGLVLMSSCGRSTANQLNYPAMTTSGSAYNSSTPTNGAYSYPAPQNAVQNASSQPVQGGRAVATANGYVYQQDPNTTNSGYDFYNKQNPCLFSKAGQSVQCSGTNAYYGNQQMTYPTRGAYPATSNTAYPTTGAYPATSNTAYPTTGAYPATSNTSYPASNTSRYVAPRTQANPYATGSSNTTYAQQRALPQTAVRPPAQNSRSASSPATNTNAQSTAASRLAPAGANTGSTSATGGESKPKVTF